jgi:hypothetical protein
MTVQGLWQNEYGSQMSLNAYPGGLVFGTYSSSTGSTGKYYVVGWQQAAEPTTAAGQPVALAIDWHSITGGQGDASWNWTSGLSGQLSIQTGAQQLVLAHAMVASSDFPHLCKAGTYIDKLIYQRVSDVAPDAPKKPEGGAAAAADPLAGAWQSSDGAVVMMLQVQPTTDNIFGWVSGKIQAGGSTFLVEGVTDINARSSGLYLQSVSITALTPTGGVVAYGGTLDLRSGALTLLALNSGATAASATYVQTTAGQLSFRRIADSTPA